MRSTMQIPLEERTEGENYLSGNKSVSGVRLNHYKLSDDGRYLEIDLSITLYRETYIPASIHNEAMLSGAWTSIAQ